MKANVVGSGVGSLASAIRLKSLGFEVNVYETCADFGGRARNFVFHNQSFDAGPTVITAPWLFDELFEILGENRKEYIEFLPCDPWYRLSFDDGSSLDLVDDIEQQIKQIAKLSKIDSDRYSDFMKHGEALYKIGYEELGTADFTKFSSMFKVLPALLKLGCSSCDETHLTPIWNPLSKPCDGGRNNVCDSSSSNGSRRDGRGAGDHRFHGQPNQRRPTGRYLHDGGPRGDRG
jgi:phytoene dehydrogenase-like protein